VAGQELAEKRKRLIKLISPNSEDPTLSHDHKSSA
jgi:hypothetical protein